VCGINLFIDKKNNPDDSVIRKMNAATRHRGPDASNFCKYETDTHIVFIGNNRLKITDTSEEANQPFISPDGRYCLSYNGELYNHAQLRQKLQARYTFRTRSDSEVLLYYLIEHKGKALEALDGMFAFVFYDRVAGTVLIARDRHGIKPVYYASTDDSILVSSEIKGILASAKIAKVLHAAQIPHYLQYKYAKRPHTFYQNIYELEPGSALHISAGNIHAEAWYHPAHTALQTLAPTSLVADVRQLLVQAVTKQLPSDSGNGLFLSGGVDSTLLLALIQEAGINKFPTFSIVNRAEDRQYGTDDYLYARKAAQQYGSQHHEYEIDASLLGHLPELLGQLDQPIGDSALLVTWLLSGKAAKRVHAVLSGAGADEWFAGYNRHRAYQFYLQKFYGRRFRIQAAKATRFFFPEGWTHPFRKKARLWNKFAADLDPDPIRTYDNFRSLHLPVALAANTSIPQTAMPPLPDQLLLHALQSDRQEYLISDILMLTDKMSMLNGLEVRVPYLDNDLTNYLSQYAPDLLLQQGPKWILKEILQNMQGEIYTQRSKEGFGIPIGKWLKEDSSTAQQILSYILSEDAILYQHISYQAVQKLWQEHRSGKRDHGTALWSLLVLAGWLQKEFS
jgi:asparagine synthase (glutamine-hydrolysing)